MFVVSGGVIDTLQPIRVQHQRAQKDEGSNNTCMCVCVCVLTTPHLKRLYFGVNDRVEDQGEVAAVPPAGNRHTPDPLHVVINTSV